MQRHPRRSSQRVANAVLHRHIRTERRSVLDVRRLSERRVGARDVVMIARDDHRRRQLAARHRVIERARDRRARAAVGVEDARLRADDQLVGARLLDPAQIVGELRGDGRRRLRGEVVAEDLRGERVGAREVVGAARGADPA